MQDAQRPTKDRGGERKKKLVREFVRRRTDRVIRAPPAKGHAEVRTTTTRG